ncbi:MAG: ABC transporter permease [Acidobacteria bacterium]|nr:ABC transporter permease [Acidobacteriota bacterium]
MRYVRHAIRHLLSRPGVSAVVILTMALTIGAATAVFSLFDAALLRPFPYASPERLVRLETHNPKDQGAPLDVSLYDFEDYRTRNRTLHSMAAYLSWTNQLTGLGPAISVHMTFVSADIFPLLGVNPVLGRVFTREEDVLGGPVLKVVIGHALWRELFGGRADALGRTIQLRGQSYEVIGVMPPGFAFPARSQVWVPLLARYSSYQDNWWKRRDARMHAVIARLKDGVSVEQANADIGSIAAALRHEHAEQSLDAHGRVRSLRDAEAGEIKPYVYLVAAAAALLLLLGCLNVANLMVARSVARERDAAVRLALGSGPWPLVWQLLAEALVLSTAGVAAGAVLAYGATCTFLALLPVDVPGWMRLELDYRVLAFAVAAAAGTAVMAMLLPAAHQLRTNLNDALKHGARGSTSGQSAAAWVRRALVVAEVALSLVLLVGAGLMVRSFQRALGIDPGLRSEHLVVVRSRHFVPNVIKESAVRAYCDVYRRVQLTLEGIPGVVSASGSHTIPFSGSSEQRRLAELYTLRRATRAQAIRLPFAGADIMPGAFQTMGVPLLEGRDFNENDKIGAPPVIVVSKRTAEALFPGESAVGQKVRFGIDQDYDPWSTVIGVVGNVRYNAAESEPGYEVYWSYRQYPGPGIAYLIRTASDPAALLPHIRQAIQSVSPNIAIKRIDTMELLVAESIWRRRLWGAILAVFAGLALLLALVGLFGVMSYMVAQQRKEIGIRLALGAGRGHVAGWVLRRGTLLSAIGAAVGLLLTMPLSSLLQGMLVGVDTNDTITLGTVLAMVIGAALLACAVPAARAARVNPISALREE